MDIYVSLFVRLDAKKHIIYIIECHSYVSIFITYILGNDRKANFAKGCHNPECNGMYAVFLKTRTVK